MDVTVSSDDEPEKIRVANNRGEDVFVAGLTIGPGQEAIVDETQEVKEAVMAGKLRYLGHE